MKWLKIYSSSNILRHRRGDTVIQGTRFGVFQQAGAARNVHERLEDAATVHRFTGIAPTVALHIPWDETDDWAGMKQYAGEIRIGVGAINPNVFQAQEYKLGSVCHHDSAVRRLATDHMLYCVEIMKNLDSKLLSLWFADGTNFPGQANFRKRKRWLCMNASVKFTMFYLRIHECSSNTSSLSPRFTTPTLLTGARRTLWQRS